MRETSGREIKSLQVLVSYFWQEKKKKEVPYAADSENNFCSFNLWNTTGKNWVRKSLIINGKEMMSIPTQIF